MPEWRRVKDDSGLLASLDVEALIRREFAIKAGRAATDSLEREIISSPHRRGMLFFYASGWSDSSSRFACVRVDNDPFGDEQELKLLYAEFAEEDRALANEGLAEFRQTMLDYDGE
jgi:hypothetical protein